LLLEGKPRWGGNRDGEKYTGTGCDIDDIWSM
jgi:hypothetical protein